MNCAFDPLTHTYRIDDRPVTSVTQVLRDVLPGWQAGEWYMQRGTAVHACAAMIARGEKFNHDARIDGQVAACRRVFEEIKPVPILVEHPVYSDRYQFAGTLDLACNIKHRDIIIDWKAQLTESAAIQCAAYALALREAHPILDVRWGMGVELHDDGTYKCCNDLYDLRRYKHEWLALLTTFNVRRRLGIKEEKGEPENV